MLVNGVDGTKADKSKQDCRKSLDEKFLNLQSTPYRVTNDQTKADEIGEEFRTQRREEQSIRNFFPTV